MKFLVKYNARSLALDRRNKWLVRSIQTRNANGVRYKRKLRIAPKYVYAR